MADARLQLAVTSAWQRRGWLAWLLSPLALLYRAALWLRRAAFSAGLIPTTRLPVPVIVVGNLVAGGTGKTPLTIELVQALRQHGWSPGVVSRGYGRTGAGVVVVGPQHDAAQVGDEPLLIRDATGAPVAVGARRVSAARELLRTHPQCDVIVADDGLQHLRLARDFEIAVLDERGLGNGWLLPAGPLREPADRLDTVDAVVLHRAGAVPPGAARHFALRSRLGDAVRRLGDRAHTMPLAELVRRQRSAGLTVTAAAGIGVPQRFFAMLGEAGLAFDPLPLPDHHDFRDGALSRCRTHLVLITEKDAVKCGRIEALRGDPRIWVVPLVASLDEALVRRVTEALEPRRKSPHGSPAA